MSPIRISRRELVGVTALVALAAALRFVGLASRGTWDADQGRDMLVLLHLVRDGTIPLLGPPTSIGEFHHGALYYYLLAPAAFLSGADPMAVVAEIALAGVAAVAVTWWLARSIAGPIAGFAAALVMTVSASAIDESTFIWNPNLIALSSAIALAGAWRARTTGRARWWLVAAIGVLVTMQCHVLGVALVPPVIGLWIATWRVARRGPERRRLRLAGLAGIVIVLLGHVPFAIYELGHDLVGTRGVLAFITAGGTGVSIALPARLLFVGLRILAWPLTGLITDGLVIGVVAGVVVATGLAWRIGQGPGRERTAARWLAATLVFGWLVLVFAAPALSSVTPLPVDHYHSFLDPIVFVALGLGAAAVWRGSPAADVDTSVGVDAVQSPSEPEVPLRVARTVVVAALAVLLAWNVATWPPGVAVDGGWPAAQAAGDRIAAALGGSAAAFVSLPAFKPTDAYRFPIEKDHPGVVEVAAEPVSPATIVIICDALFVRDCGGAAEDSYIATEGLLGATAPNLVDRWQPAPGRTISVYLPGP